MSSNLHAKIRSLVARSFKAEKLYTSSAGEASGSTEARSISTEVKAKEWGGQYKALRVSLNRLLREAPTSELAKEVYKLSKEAENTVTECNHATTKLQLEVPQASRKQEFSRLLGLSRQLLQLSARKQAAHSIQQELDAILESSMSRKAFQALRDVEVEQQQSKPESVVHVKFPRAASAR